MDLINFIWNARQQRTIDQHHSGLSRASDRLEDGLRRITELESCIDALTRGLEVTLELLSKHAGMSEDEIRDEISMRLAHAEANQTVPCPKCARINQSSRQSCMYCGETLSAPA